MTILEKDSTINVEAYKIKDFKTMQRVNRFARFWDMIANSGRFKNTLPLILGDSAFAGFMQLSDDLYRSAGSTWKIALRRLFTLVYESLKNRTDVDERALYEALRHDYSRSGEKASFESLLEQAPRVPRIGVANRRQQSH